MTILRDSSEGIYVTVPYHFAHVARINTIPSHSKSAQIYTHVSTKTLGKMQTGLSQIYGRSKAES
jgi:hypothetical protein